jgi:hypothetical protein
MKKTFLLFIVLVGLTLTGFSQAITITISDIVSIGAVLDQRTDTIPTVTPGSGGAGQTWNMSSLSSHITKQMSAVAPSTLPCGYRFTNANIALSEPDTLTNYFFSKQSTDISNVGFTMDLIGNGDTICVILSKPDTMLTLPSTYNTSFTSSSYGKTKSHINYTYLGMAVDSAEVIHITNKTSVIDGWGTLTLPNGSISALRQCLHTINLDTANAYVALLGGWVPFQTRTDTTLQYVWWAKDGGTAIVKMDYDSVTPAVTNVDWLFISDLGTHFIASEKDFLFYPNPANNSITVQAGDAYNNVYIYDITGKEIYNLNRITGQNFNIPTSELTNGIYFMKLSGKDITPTSRKFVVQH